MKQKLQMRVNSLNFFYKEEPLLKEKIIDTISLWTAIGFLWYACYQMMAEHFPSFLQVEIPNAKAGVTVEGIHISLLLLWVGLLWIAYDFPEQYLKKAGLWVQGIALAIPVVYALLYYEKITAGLLAILELYMPYVNRYYQTEYWIQGGQIEGIPMAATFLAMFLWLFCWMIAYGSKKKLFLAVFPAAVLALELAVGLSPKGNGLLAWFAAVVLLLSLGGSFVLPKLAFFVYVIAVFLGAAVFFQEQIADLTSEEQKQAVLDWQKEVLNQKQWSRYLPDFFAEKEWLRNEAPDYTGEVVFEILADKNPKLSIYLRGFYGNVYQDGKWIYDNKAFANACKEADIQPETAAKRLFQLPYERIFAYYQEQFQEASKISYEITYTGKMKDIAYVPYTSDYETLDETYGFLGDSLLKKALWDKTVEVEAAEPKLLESSMLLHILSGAEEKTSEEMDWYKAAVSEYLYVPEDMTEITKIAENLQKQQEYMDVQYMDGNVSRLVHASLVAKYLKNQMTYSLDLKQLPAGAEPVEYALTETKEGYCMHFASAGTLLLRKLGVPARYVSGYVVKPNTFHSTEDGFLAEVTDYAAHAWVEIYLDGVGWIPVEMTPGYGSEMEVLPTQKEPEESKQETETQNRETEDIVQESEKTMETESTISEEEVIEDTTATERLPSTELEEEDSSFEDEDTTLDFSGKDTVFDFLWKMLLLFAVLLAFCYWKKRYDAVLKAEIKKGDGRRAVKRINWRICMQLRLLHPNRMLWKKPCADAAYEQMLIAVFTGVSQEDWQKYMEIVKKMHYSLETISTEEVLHCYRCYEKVHYFNKFLIRK